MDLNFLSNITLKLLRMYDENLANLFNVLAWIFGTRLITMRNYMRIHHARALNFVSRTVMFLLFVIAVVTAIKFLLRVLKKKAFWVTVATFVAVFHFGVCTGQWWHCFLLISLPRGMWKLLKCTNLGMMPRSIAVTLFTLYAFYDDFMYVGVKCLFFFKLFVVPLFFIVCEIFNITFMFFVIINYVICSYKYYFN